MTSHPCLRGSSQQKRSFCNLSARSVDMPAHDGMKPVVFCVERVDDVERIEEESS
jgi:hypothetical protein